MFQISEILKVQEIIRLVIMIVLIQNKNRSDRSAQNKKCQ